MSKRFHTAEFKREAVRLAPKPGLSRRQTAVAPFPGMVTYPLDEILLATLAGIVCGADDWEGIEEIATGALDWLRGFLPFAEGVPTAQTFRKVFRLIDAQALQRGFAAWAASTRGAAREVIAVDGKTLRGSKTASDGTGALHLVSAYATEAGLVLA